MKVNNITKEFVLPCGATLKNRIVKSALTERIANTNLEATIFHEQLYKTWSETGAGLLITGNVVLDKIHLESAGNVCFENESQLPQIQKWAEAGKHNGNHIWVQISHAGRQTNILNALRPLAPSEVKLNKLGFFGKPKAMSEKDIQDVIDGFVRTASIAKKAGFTGVQIHSAHGYLLSQFLSPITNKRTDKWGGSLENRSRLLFSIIREVRKNVGKEFPIALKLNSSDFQRGGFTETESLEVIKMLNKEEIDLLEISGGTYEKVAFLVLNEDVKQKESTIKREAYFIEFANKIKTISNIPLLITGGFRTFDFCNEAIEKQQLDLIGMGRPFISNHKDIQGFIKGEVKTLDDLIIRTGIKSVEDIAEAGFYAKQLILLSKGKKVNLKMNAIWATLFYLIHELKKSITRKFS